MGKERMEGKAVLVVLLAVCTASGALAAVTCSAAGRFADTSDTSCKNYTLCVADSSGSGNYTGYDYQCPTTSLFNPATSVCTTNYTCSSNSSNSTSSVCTADGYVADPDSTTCSTYIECVEVDGSFVETTLTCPSDTYFDPSSTLCSASYNCTAVFTCSAAGRFADSTDSTCQAYYLCVQAADGSYTAYEYQCPTSSVFNPNTSVCTTSYTCPTS